MQIMFYPKKNCYMTSSACEKFKDKEAVLLMRVENGQANYGNGVLLK